MEKRAITKYVRISPYKARTTADLIRGLPVEEALNQLEFTNKKAARHLKKTLKSAIANAEQSDLRREHLIVSEVKVDGGPMLKRAKARNKGGRSPLLKRTSHFTVVVAKKA